MNFKKKKIDDLNRLTIDEYKNQPRLPLIIILDNIRSKFNVGSIFRTADSFNIEKIYLCGITPCPPDREIEKAALGASESVSWQYESNTMNLIKTLKSQNYYLIGVEQTFNSTSAFDLPQNIPSPTALILGHEINGIDEKVLEMIDMAIEIPQWGTKHSLNVSVAAAIVMWELVKRNINIS